MLIWTCSRYLRVGAVVAVALFGSCAAELARREDCVRTFPPIERRVNAAGWKLLTSKPITHCLGSRSPQTLASFTRVASTCWPKQPGRQGRWVVNLVVHRRIPDSDPSPVRPPHPDGKTRGKEDGARISTGSSCRKGAATPKHVAAGQRGAAKAPSATDRRWRPLRIHSQHAVGFLVRSCSRNVARSLAAAKLAEKEEEQ